MNKECGTICILHNIAIAPKCMAPSPTGCMFFHYFTNYILHFVRSPKICIRFVSLKKKKTCSSLFAQKKLFEYCRSQMLVCASASWFKMTADTYSYLCKRLYI